MGGSFTMGVSFTMGGSSTIDGSFSKDDAFSMGGSFYTKGGIILLLEMLRCSDPPPFYPFSGCSLKKEVSPFTEFA